MTNVPKVASNDRLVMSGGRVVDGTGAVPFDGDLLIDGDTIEAVGSPGAFTDIDAPVLDCSALVVTPGFIDIHTHSDLSRFVYPHADTRVLQGVTTEVIGNCGLGPAPGGAQPDALRPFVGPIDVCAAAPWGWPTFTDYLAALDAQPAATNVAPLVAHGALRYAAGAPIREPSSATDVADICALAESALEVGAFGISLGLMYSPSESADTAELRAIAAVAASANRLLTAHLRDYTTTGLLASIGEFFDLGAAGARLQVSHLRSVGRAAAPSAVEALRLLEQATVDAAADAYPYIAGHTSLVQLLAPELRTAGPDAAMAAIQTEPSAVAEMLQASPFDGSDILVAKLGTSDSSLVGRTLDDIAAERDTDWADIACDLLSEHDGAVDVIIFGSAPEEAADVLAHPLVMIGSDGIALGLDHHENLPHPRSIGTFPRAIATLVTSGLSIETAVRKATGAPATRLALHDRGTLRGGAKADIVAFVPDQLADRADFTHPLVPPAGIFHVLVNGQPVLWATKPTDALPGRLLSP